MRGFRRSRRWDGWRVAAAVVAASALPATLVVRHAHGQEGSATAAAAASAETRSATQDGDAGWRVESVAVRLGFFAQEGWGYQSQAGQGTWPGSEQLLVFEPIAQLTVRQGPRVRHRVVAPIDVVSSASADALDAVSSASRVNESGGVDITTTWQATPVDQLAFDYGAHFEEPLRSGHAGIGYVRSMAQDNATLGGNVGAIFDSFNHIEPDGQKHGHDQRVTVTANLMASQILSPTTLLLGSYGITWQTGTLEQTWNSVPLEVPTEEGDRVAEKLPGTRLRQAWSAQVLQHIPQTRSTVRLTYRYYMDDFGLRAQTVEVRWYQYLSASVYMRASYRYYRQTGVDFFTQRLSPNVPMDAPRTADSDLAPFRANEIGLRAVWMLGPLAADGRRAHEVDVSYVRYDRTNNLGMNVIGTGYAHHF